jgi:hypothetical protein
VGRARGGGQQGGNELGGSGGTGEEGWEGERGGAGGEGEGGGQFFFKIIFVIEHF